MGHKILIADDEQSIVLSLEFLLEARGYQVRSVADGEQAIAAAREFAPDLLVLDVMMPGRSGYEVCQALRADPAHAGLKILMLSAKGRDVEVAKGLHLGADAYMTKPFSTRELVDRVGALLGSAQP